jgi:hypothetical protein
MTDYFALLQQQRRPWLDAAELKNKYYELARQAPPDHQTNQAYRTLVDPRSRLEHLLALEGLAPTASPTQVPDELVSLFMEIAPLLNKPGITVAAIDPVTADLTNLRDEALGDLRTADAVWVSGRTEAILLVQAVYQRLSYLSRWLELLQEQRLACA